MDKKVKKISKTEQKKRQLAAMDKKENEEEENRAPLVMVRHNRECTANRVYDLFIPNITII